MSPYVLMCSVGSLRSGTTVDLYKGHTYGLVLPDGPMVAVETKHVRGFVVVPRTALKWVQPKKSSWFLSRILGLQKSPYKTLKEPL